LKNRETIKAKIRRGIDQHDRDEGIPEDQLDAHLTKLKSQTSMSVRNVLAPQAALDLVEIWRYIKNQASLAIADRVESAIGEKIVFLAGTPGAGHSPKDLTGKM